MIDFTGSEDIVIENSEDMQISTIIDAESADTVAIVKEFIHSRLHWQVSWHKQQPSQDKITQYSMKAAAQLKGPIERAKKIFKKFPLAESTLEEIEAHLLENTCKNFVDPEFPPCDESVYR